MLNGDMTSRSGVEQRSATMTTTATLTPTTNTQQPTSTNTNTTINRPSQPQQQQPQPQQQQQTQQQNQQSQQPPSQPPHHYNHHHNHPVKTDEIEILESAGGDDQQPDKLTTGWICCAPCIWLRTSATVHKIAITTATLLVTSLLVASPVLFLLSTAPSQLPKDCYTAKNELDCVPTRAPIPECTLPECQSVALSLLARMNWKLDPCNHFRDFSCSSAEGSLKAVKSPQEGVDLQMQHLLTHNTTSGLFRKLGRLYGSCLRLTINSVSIRLKLNELGGYLPIGTMGPSSISPLITKMHKMGPTPLISIYYDLSYNKQPQTMLIIDGSSESSPVIESLMRWKGPKSPPYRIRDSISPLANELLDHFLPNGLSNDQKNIEKSIIINFINELYELQRDSIRRDFSDSYLTYNASSLIQLYPFLNWNDLIPSNWTGPILLRSSDYLKGLQLFMNKHPTRLVHNSLLVIFALSILPPGRPDALICTRATMWAMPDVSSALYMAQFPQKNINSAIIRADIIFGVLKAYLKRAPSLKGAALVKLSQLKLQINPWHTLTNLSILSGMLDGIEISSDNWFENILRIYAFRGTTNTNIFENDELTIDGEHSAWAYPTVAKIFYDTLSHSIVVPLSVILVPYFNIKLPPYMHYASVGSSIATQILHSITKSFEEKIMKCVPQSVNIISNASRMDILIQSGGMQIAYHSLLSLAGPMKGMIRLPGIHLNPMQIFFLVFAQEVCADMSYAGVDTYSDDWADILTWLIAQGGSATQVYQCPYQSNVNLQKMCNIL